MLVLILALSAPPKVAWAGGGAPCFEPFVFSHSDVNIVVVPYTLRGPDKRYNYGQNTFGRGSDSLAGRLSQVMQLDALFSLRYPAGMAAVYLQGEAEECAADKVLARILDAGEGNTIAPGKGLVLLWGRFFELGDEIYVQSYVRFFRRGRQERLALDLGGGGSLGLEAFLPGPTIAFAPRLVTSADLAAIGRAFAEATVIWSESSGGNQIGELGIGPEETFAYIVDAVDDASGRMHIRPQRGSRGVKGWVKARTDPAQWPLRRVLPELNLVKALAGFLAFQIVEDSRPPPNWAGAWPDRLALARRRAKEAFDDYRAALLPGLDFDALAPADLRPQSTRAETRAIAGEERMALAASFALSAAMDFKAATGGWLAPEAAETALTEAIRGAERARALAPADAALHGLAALVEAERCCAEGGVAPSVKVVLRRLGAGLSTDPQDALALANLVAVYQLLLAKNAAVKAGLDIGEVEERLKRLRRIQETRRAALPPLRSRYVVFFDSGQTRLSIAGRREVVETLRAAAQSATSRILLHGYSDPAGPASLNLRVSRKRVKAVARALMDGGIDPTRIVELAHGEDDPATATASPPPAEKLRRVEIVFEQ